MKSISFFLLFVAFFGKVSAYQLQEIRAPQLKASVVVRIDRFGVPHITAENAYDLFFVQGYLTAKDRLFQMDYYRRGAKGELAEILGEKKVEDDYWARLLGFRYQAEAINRQSPKAIQEILQAYSDGVNEYIKESRDLPYPFKKLHYKPAPWQPADSLVFGRVMSWRLSESLSEELSLAQFLKEAGIHLLFKLLRLHPAEPITIMRARELKSLLPEEFLPRTEKVLLSLEQLNQEFAWISQEAGSNNWVVAPKKSATGYAMLANDPHLSLTSPSIWHEVHLKMPGLNVIGVTFPGIPGVIIGHNERIAWGVTTVGYDVLDIYLEKKDLKRKGFYLYKEKSEPLIKRKVIIRYREGRKLKESKKEIRYTRHGPVIAETANHYIAFRWTGLDPTFEVEAFFEIMKASNVQEFKKALRKFRVGAQNFVYADVDGNIFWQAAGEVPTRPKGCIPYLPMDGSSGKCEWQASIPYEKLPQLLNPQRGYIATANNRPIDKRYPYYIGTFFDSGFRARRITEMLQEKEKLSFKDLQRIQLDNLSIPGREITPKIVQALNKESLKGIEKEAYEALRQWDFHTDTESIGATIFHKTLQRAAIYTLKDEMPEKIFRHVAGRSEIILALLLKSSPEDPLFDDKNTKQRETRDDILKKSFLDAVEELKKLLGDRVSRWQWGKLHTLRLSHLALRELDLGPFSLPGAMHTVNNAGFGMLGDFNFGGGPSLRFVAELKGKVEHAENVIPGGQSSHPASPHYKDQLKLWMKGEARPMFFDESDVQQNTQAKLLFRP